MWRAQCIIQRNPDFLLWIGPVGGQLGVILKLWSCGDEHHHHHHHHHVFRLWALAECITPASRQASASLLQNNQLAASLSETTNQVWILFLRNTHRSNFLNYIPHENPFLQNKDVWELMCPVEQKKRSDRSMNFITLHLLSSNESNLQHHANSCSKSCWASYIKAGGELESVDTPSSIAL